MAASTHNRLQSLPTDYKKDKLKEIRRNTKVKGQCQVWQGCRSKSGYGKIKIKQQTDVVHRVVYFFETESESRTREDDGQWDVSHLCHNKCCIRIDHLTYEPHAVNTQRRKCHRTCRGRRRVCVGHGDYPACILDT